MPQPKYTSTINWTESENKIVEELQAKGIKIVSIFRRGLSIYEKELQDNVDK